MNAGHTQRFGTFIRRRRAQKHFERRPLLDALVATPVGVPSGGGAGIAALGLDVLAVARDEPAAALVRLQSKADSLDAAEAARRLMRDGPNEVQHEPPLPGWLRL